MGVCRRVQFRRQSLKTQAEPSRRPSCTRRHQSLTMVRTGGRRRDICRITRGSWTTSDDGSMTSDDASMEVHDATSPRLPLTQSDRWSMSTNPSSSPASSTFSDHGSTDYYTGTSDIQSASSSKFHPSSDNCLTPDDHLADGHWTTSFEEPESMSFLSKLVSKLKFWRCISGTASGAVNAAQRELQGTAVDTRAYVSVSSRVTNILNLFWTFVFDSLKSA